MKKSNAFNRFICLFLTVWMILSLIPASVIATTVDSIGDAARVALSSATVSAEGLPEGASVTLKAVSNPFSRKLNIRKTQSASSSPKSTQPLFSGSDFLAFYDIKAVDADNKAVDVNGEVTVTIKNAAIAKDQSVAIVHILDDVNAIKNNKNVVLVEDSSYVSAFADAAEATFEATGKEGTVAIEIISDPEVNGRDITFKTSSFSIFAVAENPILTVNFYKAAKSDSNRITSIRVKKADIDSDASTNVFDSIVYDPGIDYTPQAHILFRGWWTSNDYTVADAQNALTIAGVRSAIKTKLNSMSSTDQNEVLDFFAMLYVQYTVTYFDQAGVVCLGRDYVLQRSDEAAQQIDYQVTLNYVPYGQFENFEGWKLKSGDKHQSGDNFYNNAKENLVGIYTGGDNTSGTLQENTIGNPPVDVRDYVYKTPTWTQIKGDIYLQAEAPEGKWLIFDENGKGGTYIAPQFVKTRNNTINPNNSTDTDLGYPVRMTRYGYTFGGWYYFPEGVTIPTADSNGSRDLTNALPFTFGGELEANTRIYAKWTPNTSANYTIIFWTQNVNRDGYHVQDSIVVENATVGQNIPYTYKDNGDEDYTYLTTGTYGRFGANQDVVGYTTVNGEREPNHIVGHYMGFNLRADCQNKQVEITPEGDAVLNLYYDRITYNFKFYLYRQSGSMQTIGYEYTESTNDNSNNPEKYGDVNGQKARVYWINQAFRTRNQRNATVYNGTVYTRTEIQDFVLNDNYDYANNSGTGSDLNGLVTWHTNQSAHPSVNGYTIQSETVGNYVYYYFTISAYYGEDISSKWPTYDKIIGANNREAVSYVMMVGTRLKPNPTSGGSGTVKGIITVMNENILGATNNVNGNYVMVRFPASYNNWRYHIWFETVEGEDYTGKTLHEYDGKTYYEETVLTVRSSNTDDNNQNEPKYQGFDYITRLGQNNNGTVWQGGHWTTTENGTTLYHLNYVYNRQQYQISYFNGQYVDGNGNNLQSKAGQPLHSSPDIGYRVTISDEYKNYVPTLPEGDSGYVFEGWYVDEGCTTPYTWSTMPEGGIEIYAKWRQIQYRVFLHPNAGSATEEVNGEVADTRDLSLDWGSDDQSMNFRVSYGSTISVPTGTRTSYYFGGWFTDPECTKSFIPVAELNEQTVTSDYNKQTDLTDDMDKWGDLHGKGDHTEPWNSDVVGNNGGDRFWITKKLDLYAKWRRKLPGSQGIYVKYTTEDNQGNVGQFDDGSEVFFDGMLYSDGAFAYGIAACNGLTTNTGKELHFKYWVVQAWNASKNSFEDSDTIIYPGQRFETSYEYAQRVDVPETDPTYNKPETPTFNENLPEHYYDYYMVIRAEYTEATPQDTTLVYDANGGTFTSVPTGFTSGTDGGYNIISTELIVNHPFDIQPGTIVTREGYNFKGWSLERNGEKWLNGGETNYSADNLTANPDGNDPSNTLYAVWEIIKYPVKVTKTVDDNGLTGMAANTFTFNYTVTFPQGYTENGNSNKTGSITITGSGEATIADVPHGSTVSVTEVTPAGYTVNSATQQLGPVKTEDGVIAFTNTRDKATVTITKEVVGSSADKTKTFTFNAVLTYNGGTYSLPATDAQFTLSDGGTKTITIPVGASLKITEAVDTDFVTEINGAATNEFTSGKLSKDQTASVTFTNTRLIDVKVKKALDNKGITDSWNTFDFPLVVTVNGTETTASYSVNGSGAEVTIPGVRYGSTLVVAENTDAKNGSDAIKTVFETEVVNGSVTANESTPVIEVKNTRKTFTVIVTKIAEHFADNRKFNFTSEGLPAPQGGWDQSGTGKFSIGNGQLKSFAEIPYGTKIKIHEEDIPAEYTRSVIGQHTETGAQVNFQDATEYTVMDNITIVYTNILQKYDLTVTKTVESLDPDDKDPTKKTFTITVNYTLPNGTQSSSVLTLGNGQSGTVTNLFYGTTYTVEETAVDYFTSTVTPSSGTIKGASSVAVLNKRETVDIDISKKVSYSGDANTEFSFTVTAPGVSETVTAKQGTNSAKVTVPKGSTVEITETNPLEDSTVTSIASQTKGNASISFTAESNTTVEYLNKRNPVRVDVGKEFEENANFTVDGDKNHKFTIKVTYTDDNGELHTEEAHQLSDGQSKSFEILYGSDVTVTEVLDGDDAVQFETVSGTGIYEKLTSQKDIVVKNKRKETTITVTKAITNATAAVDYADRQFGFAVTFTAGGVTLASANANGGSFQLATGASQTVIVPKGFELTITEAADSLFNPYYTLPGASETAGNAATLTAGDNATVAFRNDRKPLTVQVHKVVDDIWNIDADTEFSFNINGVNGDVNLKGGEIFGIDNVEYGSSLTAKEIADAAFTTKSGIGTNENAATAAQASQTIDKVTEDADIWFVNTRKIVRVDVKKIVDHYLDEDLNREFQFDISAMFGNQTITPSASATAATPAAESPIGLMHNGTGTFYVPYGAAVKVQEQSHNGFASSATFNGTKYIQSEFTPALTASTNEIIVTNDREYVLVTVNKKVIAQGFEDIDNAIAFPFTYSWNWVDGNYTISRSGTFSIANGENSQIQVPKGASVTVTETTTGTGATIEAYNGASIATVFDTKVKVGSTTTDAATTTVTAENPISVEFINEHKMVTFQIKKVVDNSKWNIRGDLETEFLFDWSSDKGFAGAERLKSGKTTDPIEVPYFSIVTVDEAANEAFDTTNDISDGKTHAVTGNLTAENTVITFTNTRKDVSVTVKKATVGTEEDKNIPFTFNAVVTLNGETVTLPATSAEFTLTNAGTSQPKVIEIPYGSLITVTENTDKSVTVGGKSYTVSQVYDTVHKDNVSQTTDAAGNAHSITSAITDKNTLITFTNTHKLVDVKVVKAVDSDQDDDLTRSYPLTYTRVTGDDATITASETPTNWTVDTPVTFKAYFGTAVTVSENLSQDDLAKYSVSIAGEDVSTITFNPADSAAATVITITNKRNPGNLIITKTVYEKDGTTVKNTSDAFVFRIERTDATGFAPLTVVIKGNGSVSIMNLPAGTYKVTEISDWSWKYKAASTAETATVTGGVAATVGFKNTDKAPNWLNNEASLANNFARLG